MANEYHVFGGRPTPIPTGRPARLREAIRQLLGERALTDEVATRLAATHGVRCRDAGSRHRNGQRTAQSATDGQGRLIA